MNFIVCYGKLVPPFFCVWSKQPWFMSFFTLIFTINTYFYSMKYFWHISIYLQNSTRRNACHQIVIRVCLVAVKVDNPLVWSASVDSPKKEDKRDFVGDWQDYQNINELLVMYALDLRKRLNFQNHFFISYPTRKTVVHKYIL